MHQHFLSVLLDLSFFVDHMLANDGIELLDLKLFWLGAFVLGRGVEVAGTGAGFKLDFVTHDEFLKNVLPSFRLGFISMRF
jgi:hypothetical protein